MKRLRLLMMFLLLGAGTSVMAQEATIATDSADYHPGSTAIITGSGFQAGEDVVVLVEHYGGDALGTDPQYHQPWTVTADTEGNFTTSWLVPSDGDALGATFLLTADGQVSGIHAEAIFTDASSVTPASQGTNIPADKSANSVSPAGGTFTTLGDITITEGQRDDISTGGTIILTAPTGWKFNTGVGTVSFTASRDITAATIAVTSTTITVTLTIPTTTATDQFVISGIQVKADAGQNLANNGNILRTGGTATINGISGTTNFG